MAPKGRTLQPAAAWAVPATAAGTAPLRSHSPVWSWSSTDSSASTGASAAKAAITWWHRRRPVSVARQGCSRTTRAQPTRSFSARMRWDTADGVT